MIQAWLDNVDQSTLTELAERLEVISLVAGQVLFSQNNPGDCMYLIVEGELEVLINDDEAGEWLVDRLNPGDIVGEMALLTGQHRAATVRASKPTELHRLMRDDFEQLSDQDPELLIGLGEYVEPRLQRTQLVGALAGIFGPLELQPLHDLQQRSTWLHIPAGQFIDSTNEPSGSMYMVVNGRLSVRKFMDDGRQSIQGEIARGDTVGQFNLLSGENESLKLVALRDSDVVRISQDAIESLLRATPESVMRFVRRTTGRLHPASEIIQEESISALSIALVPLHEGLDLSDFVEQTLHFLQKYGPSIHLSGAEFEKSYGKKRAALTRQTDVTNIPIVHWLTEQEQSHKFVVYECDPSWSPWTRRSLRQADRIVLLTDATRSAERSKLEQAIEDESFSAEKEMVLFHAPSVQFPTGTAAWLSPRSIKAHHHVRKSNPTDVGRFVRRLIGKAIALVVSGGGARGFAHAGVYRALQEAGIPVDLIGGTSMGALVGGSLAQGDGDKGALDHADKWGSPRSLYDFTIPAVSFMASHKLTRMLQAIFSERRIEDLLIPFFCVSADLTDAQPIIHREGLLWEAVRGSLAIPGIFSPMMFEGDVLVDGGVMNNFPIDLMRDDVPTGWVIGVNVSPPREVRQDYNFEPGLSGWRVILSRLNPLNKKLRVPSIFSILTRSVEVKGIYQLAQVIDKADTLIRPNVEPWNYLDFRPAPEIADAGYQATMAIMDELVAGLKEREFIHTPPE